jgi:hypothetical protein
MKSIFGWDLPPGCTNADIERVAGGDLPPCCNDCNIDPCNKPCDKLKVVMIQKEEFWKKEAEEFLKASKEF